jgi:hypothetical protein
VPTVGRVATSVIGSPLHHGCKIDQMNLLTSPGGKTPLVRIAVLRWKDPGLTPPSSP